MIDDYNYLKPFVIEKNEIILNLRCTSPGFQGGLSVCVYVFKME